MAFIEVSRSVQKCVTGKIKKKNIKLTSCLTVGNCVSLVAPVTGHFLAIVRALVKDGGQDALHLTPRSSARGMLNCSKCWHRLHRRPATPGR